MKWWDTLMMQEANDATFKRGTLALVDDDGRELIGLGIDKDGAPLLWVDDEIRQLLDRLHRTPRSPFFREIEPIKAAFKVSGGMANRVWRDLHPDMIDDEMAEPLNTQERT